MSESTQARRLPPQMQPKGNPQSCAQCGQTFYRRPSHGGLYCSRQCAGVAKRVPLAERFWKYVDKSNDPDACWPWQAYRNPDGYGEVGAGPGERSMLLAHRVAWELAHGPIPPGMAVCHRCDNPPCCHAECDVPGCDHLKDSPGCRSHHFLGTIALNHADQQAKGRKPVGDQTRAARLQRSQADAIRTRYAAGNISQHDLAREYGVAVMTINRLVRGISWPQ